MSAVRECVGVSPWYAHSPGNQDAGRYQQRLTHDPHLPLRTMGLLDTADCGYRCMGSHTRGVCVRVCRWPH